MSYSWGLESRDSLSFSFIFLCIFQQFLNKHITLMDSMAKNMCFEGKQTSEQALFYHLLH